MQYEFIGIAASLFVLLSFVVNDIRQVRYINIIGAVLFVVYGYCIASFSTAFLNSALILIHVYYLNQKNEE